MLDVDAETQNKQKIRTFVTDEQNHIKDLFQVFIVVTVAGMLYMVIINIEISQQSSMTGHH